MASEVESKAINLKDNQTNERRNGGQRRGDYLGRMSAGIGEMYFWWVLGVWKCPED